MFFEWRSYPPVNFPWLRRELDLRACVHWNPSYWVVKKVEKIKNYPRGDQNRKETAWTIGAGRTRLYIECLRFGSDSFLIFWFFGFQGYSCFHVHWPIWFGFTGMQMSFGWLFWVVVCLVWWRIGCWAFGVLTSGLLIQFLKGSWTADRNSANESPKLHTRKP